MGKFELSKYFTPPTELLDLVENDLALMLTEYFETARSEAHAADEGMPQPLTNMPIPRNRLVGRENELATACDLLTQDDVGLVTLTGAGGGKGQIANIVSMTMQRVQG